MSSACLTLTVIVLACLTLAYKTRELTERSEGKRQQTVTEMFSCMLFNPIRL